MAGGLSQLESWDPKPGTATGGPFRSIPTSVPGIHISELLPDTAKQMHHLCLVRGVNTSEDDHGKGAYLMMTGRRQNPASDYPQIGAVAAKALQPINTSLPGHILITPGGGGGRGNDAAYLGPKYASVQLGNGNPPQNTVRPDSISSASETARQDFRRHINENFLNRRRTAVTEAFTYSFEQAQQLMLEREVFDVSKEPAKDADRFGKYDFGRHCLLARRLLEKGITFVQVTHANYDTHNENFNFHIEQLGEFDRSFACFVNDLAARGMLDSTLIIVLSEFGRTPGINMHLGRDHWSKAWSVCLGGCRIPRGVAYGKTNADGTEVVDKQVDHGALFHTYLEAVGVDSTGTFAIDGRKMPIADPAASAVAELLT
jgi:arylsulfatase A-like enzyme